MSKFKLIKKYPGCEYPLNCVIDTYFIWKNGEKVYLENFPDNWEKVVEEEYEILSVNYFIHSVKRLSDNEILTVGDNVYSTLGSKESWRNCYIKEFQFKNNKLKISVIENETTGLYSLEDLKVFKEKLFTTEDGVDIFNGDKTCWINDWHITNFTDWQRTEASNEKHFSTVAAAEHYILMNKPC